MKRHELIVIGAGPAGLSAAIEAKKNGMDVIVFDENQRPGGQLFKQIHKFFGSKEHHAKVRGFRIGQQLLEEAEGLGVRVELDATVMGIYENKEVTVKKDGEVHQVGTPQEIYFEPKTQFVADFIGTTNLISVEGKGNNDVAYGNTVFHSTNPVTPGARYVASVRPESIKISLEKAEGKVNIKTSIVNRMFLGEKVRYFVKDELDKEWIVDMFDPGKTLLSGDAYVTFKAEKAWVIEDK